MLLSITNIQRFSTHDGPGVRTTVFFQGCPLRCAWCHNPETQSGCPMLFYVAGRCIGCGACVKACPNGAHSMHPFGRTGRHDYDATLCKGCFRCTEACPAKAVEPVSRMLDPVEIMEIVLKDKVFYGEKGGITLSGGEPLLQAGGCLELLRLAKDNGLNTVVETAGHFDATHLAPIAALTDLFLWDFKDGNAKRHKEYTGVSNALILKNLRAADALGSKILLRSMLAKGINLEEEHLHSLAETASGLKHCIGVELLSYHPYGGSKSEQMGLGDNGRKDWIPSAEEMRLAGETLHRLMRPGIREPE